MPWSRIKLSGTLFKMKTVIEDKIEAAKLALANIEDVLQAQSSIITQTQINIDKIGDSLTEVDSQYKAQELVTLDARTTYLVGVENWKTQQQLTLHWRFSKQSPRLVSAVSGVFMCEFRRQRPNRAIG